MKEREVLGLAVVGGVSANAELRIEMQKLALKNQIPFMVPDFQYCTDNAGMDS